MNIQSFKIGSKIHIKKANKGKFTDYCGGKVTGACIQKAKQSGNSKLVKRAVFAENARKWKHENGGSMNGSPLQQTIDSLTKKQQIKNNKKHKQIKKALNGIQINGDPYSVQQKALNNMQMKQQNRLNYIQEQKELKNKQEEAIKANNLKAQNLIKTISPMLTNLTKIGANNINTNIQNNLKKEEETNKWFQDYTIDKINNKNIYSTNLGNPYEDWFNQQLITNANNILNSSVNNKLDPQAVSLASEQINSSNKKIDNGHV